jgi:hypothetical protein
LTTHIDGTGGDSFPESFPNSSDTASQRRFVVINKATGSPVHPGRLTEQDANAEALIRNVDAEAEGQFAAYPCAGWAS